VRPRVIPPWRSVAVGLLLWFGVGAVAAGLLALAMHASNAFALSGLMLVVVSVGWALGPFKTPMVWSEGALMSYQGNVRPNGAGLGLSRWRLMGVPAFACAAGVLLLVVAGVMATQ
jgi:hypothetical protein